MNYTVLGPFNIDEARTLSTSYSWECLPWAWGDKTHLESAGKTAITNAEIMSNKQASQHGLNESTILYKDVKLILCQVEHFSESRKILDNLKGYYIMDSKITESFLKGFKILINDKKEPNSKLNKQLRELRIQIKQKIKDAKNLTEKDYLDLQKINESKILEEPDYKILENLNLKLKHNKPKTIDQKELDLFLDNIYINNTDMPTIRKGSVFYHFGLPVENLIDTALEETIQTMIKYEKLTEKEAQNYINKMTQYMNTQDKLTQYLFGFD